MISTYKISVSFWGLVIYALQLLPNIIWVRFPPSNNVLTQNTSPYPIRNVLEQITGILTVATLILIMPKNAVRNSHIFLILSIISILGYYVSWFFYYQGNVNPWLLIIGIAAMPPLYFAFSAIWLRNYIALIPCIVFGIVHVFITGQTYL